MFGSVDRGVTYRGRSLSKPARRPVIRPIDVATAHTLNFVTEHLTGKGALRVLEIGCGSGELAAAIQETGHTVVAIDAEPEMVARAVELGVPALTAEWPAFQDDPFDVILFSRSLHHIRPLEASIRHANELLLKNGLLIVEDFAFDAVTDETLAWFCHVLKLLTLVRS